MYLLLKNTTIEDIVLNSNIPNLQKMLDDRKRKLIVNELTKRVTMSDNTNIKKERSIFPFPVVGGHVVVHELVSQYVM